MQILSSSSSYLEKGSLILRLPEIFSIISVVFIMCFGMSFVLADDKQLLPKSEVLRLIEKIQVAGSNKTFTGTALFETSGAARRMSNISQGKIGGETKRKVVSMSKRPVVEIYFNNTLYLQSKHLN